MKISLSELPSASHEIGSISSTGRLPPALAFVGPSASSRRIPRGQGVGRRFDLRSATRGLVCLTSMDVQAVSRAHPPA